MNDRTIISVSGISKIYKLYDRLSDRAKEAVNPFKRSYHTDFYALKGISFEVHEGETFGIIGRNGSGKSTILKILTGVTTQTAGTARVGGKVSALLELGAGLNPEMTGIDNIYLNGSMQGYSRKQMDAKLDDIVDFADIGEFMNQPVKTYSSGMFVRLAFALAINTDPDILIVDEALSVGDIYFQAKCYKKFEDFKARGKTIIFVTHDMNSVLKYCDRAMVLEKGEKLAEGGPKEMVDLYKKVMVNLHKEGPGNGSMTDATAVPETNWKEKMVINQTALDYGDGKIRIVDFGLFDEVGAISQSISKDHSCSIRMRVKIMEDIESPIFAMTIKDIKGNELTGTNSKIEEMQVGHLEKGTELIISFEQTMILQGGQYLVSFGCTRFDENGEFVVHHRLYDIFAFQVLASKFVVGIFDMGMRMEINRIDHHH